MFIPEEKVSSTELDFIVNYFQPPIWLFSTIKNTDHYEAKSYDISKNLSNFYGDFDNFTDFNSTDFNNTYMNLTDYNITDENYSTDKNLDSDNLGECLIFTEKNQVEVSLR